MKEKRRPGAAGTILRAVSVLLAAAGMSVAFSWWQMPYLHHDWYGNDLNVILHILTFVSCLVPCILTFLFAERDRRIPAAGGGLVLVLALVSTLVNEGFVPNLGTLVIGLISILYLIAVFLSAGADRPEKKSLDELMRKFRTSRTIAVISGAAAAFSIIFPKKEAVFSQHMGPDGPGVIEYYDRYTDFGIFLMVVIPISLVILTIFAVRAGLLNDRIRRLKAKE